MQTFKCHLCQNEYDNYTSISLHYRKSHKICSEEVRKIIYNNGENPLCKCGCHEVVGWNYKEEKFNDFKHGHYVRTIGGFYSDIGLAKSLQRRKERFATGELQQWNKGISYEESYGKERADLLKKSISENEERSKKISEFHKGKPKSPEHREQMKKQLAINRRERLTSGKMSKPERLMEDILKSNGIDYVYQHEVSGFFYDFYIPSKNILIEVDGDFWHCKPGTKYETPITEEQTKNAVNDKKKTAIAYSNSYTLLRFWESDIQDNRLQVVKTLIENLL
jgi:very-short-patch-repair endonuclease